MSYILQREVSIEESIAKFSPKFPKLFEAFEISCPELKKTAMTKWGSISDDFSFEFFHEIEDLLRGLPKKGINIHLWTAWDETSTLKILGDAGLDSFFSTINCGTSLYSKPLASNLKWDWSKIPKDSILMLGDSSTDMLGAQNINTISAAALWCNYSDQRSLVTAGVELFFYSPQEFFGWILQKLS
jgi:phosphoglycolate phosphatase-like HAD superfamily hydrolase